MRKVAYLILILSLVFLGDYLQRSSALADTPQPPERPARDLVMQDSASVVPQSPQSPGLQSAQQPLELADLGDWSRIVFQSVRGGNWDLYLTRGPGHEQANLMPSAETETYPRLNRGATHVAYASNRAGNYDIWVMPVNGQYPGQLTANPANDYEPSWSPDGRKIAFNSFRDGQSEIYVMNVDGSGQTRLTYDAAYDGQAAWSPDGARIAFMSTRSTGGKTPTIWVMNPDGSGQRQLGGIAYSQHPTWSPDSTQIAFDADGNANGWQELWLMNADGTNQRHIYSAGEAQTDTWPRGWSPDGGYIAFSRVSFINYQGNWYWTAGYLDAYSVQYGSALRISSNGEDWYPDWQSIDLTPPVSHVNALPAQSPATFTVSWGGSDSGPAGVHSYDVQWREGPLGTWQSWWTWTDRTSDSFSGLGGTTFQFRSRARDNAGNVEAWHSAPDASTTIESLPPVAALSLLPAFSRLTANLAWSAYDVGGSGVQDYDLEAQAPGVSTWTPLLSAYRDTSWRYTPESGGTYRFRVRARDNGGTVGAWSADLPTTIYAYGISGIVRDARGVPLPGVTMATAPGTLAPITTTVAGRYNGYTLQGGDYVITATKQGYGSTPPVVVSVHADQALDHVLLPEDNLTQNGGFEWGGIAPPGWLLGGAYTATVTNLLQHSGENAAYAGMPEFTRPVTVTESSCSNVHAAADTEGRLHLTWSVPWPTIYQWCDIMYAQRGVDGLWSPPVNVSQSTRQSMDSAIAVGDDGFVHLAWDEMLSNDSYGSVAYASRSPDGVWSVPITLTQSGRLPRLIVDGQGTVHAAWETRDGLGLSYAFRPAHGAWSPPQALPGYSNPLLVAGSDGAIDMLSNGPNNGWGSAVYDTRIGRGGVMGLPQNLSGSGVASSREELAMVRDAAGTLHAFWYGALGDQAGTVFCVRRAPGGGWSAPEAIMSGVSSSGKLQALLGPDGIERVFAHGYYTEHSGSIWLPKEQVGVESYWPDQTNGATATLTGDGSVHVVWPSGWPPEIRYRRRLPGGGWIPAQRLSLPDVRNEGALITAGGGRIFVLWREVFPGVTARVSYVMSASAPETGDATLSQRVTIPVTTTNPTLSFFHQVSSIVPTTAAYFYVSVDTAGERTQVYSTTVASGLWSQHWVDMAPWSGQAVTLTFGVHQAAGAPAISAAVDDVSLGSWLTPAPQMVWPNRSDVWTPLTITITGQNFLSGPGGQAPELRLGTVALTDTHLLSSTTMTATVPGLGLGQYDLVITNPSGQSGGMWRALTVGKSVYLPVIVSNR